MGKVLLPAPLAEKQEELVVRKQQAHTGAFLLTLCKLSLIAAGFTSALLVPQPSRLFLLVQGPCCILYAKGISPPGDKCTPLHGTALLPTLPAQGVMVPCLKPAFSRQSSFSSTQLVSLISDMNEAFPG